MNIDELYWNAVEYARDDAPDLQLIDRMGLEETELIDFRATLREGKVGLILAGGPETFGANTCVLVADGVVTSSFIRFARLTRFTAYTVGYSTIEQAREGLLANFLFESVGEMAIVAKRLDIYFGNVRSLPSNPPDYEFDAPAKIRDNLPSWQSEFEVVHRRMIASTQ
ncbi:hypothetical protein BH09ACT1_BH09ACT1_26180 [soil metagenome]